MRIWLLALFLAFPRAYAQAPAQYSQDKAKEIAEGRYWHLLLHYKRSFFGGYKSEADGPEFFLSPQGRRDPYKELAATIDSFFRTDLKIGNLKQHPQCAFPERYRYLKKELHLNVADVYCKDFREWKPRFNAKSVTLVFASAYFGNAASMFGHTFLRIDSKPRAYNDHKNDLLDYGVNYGAITGNDGMVAFAFLGLTGGYRGLFSLAPYSDKVKEYHDVESRDLWEYRLNLDEEQIDRMLNHLWELGTTWFDYYFFSKNCSYHLLSLLEVARPELHLTDRFFYWVIPTDTVRIVNQVPGLVANVSFRPSLYRQLLQRLSAMTDGEREDFSKYEAKPSALTGRESALVLDALIDERTYSQMKAGRTPDERDQEVRRQLLLARAKSEDAAKPIPSTLATNRPDVGNNSEKISFYGGVKKDNSYLGMQLRPAFHDLLDDDEGYMRSSEINFARLDLRYYFEGGERLFRLHELGLVEIISLDAIDEVNHGLSWTVRVGAYSPSDLTCHECTAARVTAGLGYSAYLSRARQKGLVYALLKPSIEYSGYFNDALRFGPTLDAGFLLDVTERVKAGLEASSFYYPTQLSGKRYFTKFSAKASWCFAKNFEFRLASTHDFIGDQAIHDHSGTLSWYF